jgi:hypothetical protein
MFISDALVCFKTNHSYIDWVIIKLERRKLNFHTSILRFIRKEVSCRLISRQRPKYAHGTIELEEVFSMWSASCPVLGNGSINTHSDNRRGVFKRSAPCPVLGNGPMNMHSGNWHVFTAGSDLHNER